MGFMSQRWHRCTRFNCINAATPLIDKNLKTSMNTSSKGVENNIFVAQNGSYSDDMYKLCLSVAQSGQLVLLMTSTNGYDLLSLVERELPLEFAAAKQVLERFIVMLIPNLDSLIHKLLELHGWNEQPALVIVDLASLVRASQAEVMREPLFHMICLCIASLFSYMKALQRQRQTAQAVQPTISESLTILEEHVEWLTSVQLELLLNLYYYKDQAFDDFARVLSKLKALQNEKT